MTKRCSNMIRQLNRWPCHWVSETFYFSVFREHCKAVRDKDKDMQSYLVIKWPGQYSQFLWCFVIMIVQFPFPIALYSSNFYVSANGLFIIEQKGYFTNLVLCIFARVKAAGRLLHILFVLLYKFRRYVLVMIVLFHRRTGVETSKPSILSVFSNKKYLSSVCPKAKYIQLAWLCFLWHIG